MSDPKEACMAEAPYGIGFCYEEKGHDGPHESHHNGQINNWANDEEETTPEDRAEEFHRNIMVSIDRFGKRLTERLGAIALRGDALLMAASSVQRAWEVYAADPDEPNHRDALRDSITRYLVPAMDAIRGESIDWCTDPECDSVDVNHTH